MSNSCKGGDQLVFDMPIVDRPPILDWYTRLTMIGDECSLSEFSEKDAELILDEILKYHKDRLVDALYEAVTMDDQDTATSRLAQEVINGLARRVLASVESGGLLQPFD